jgi:hypothetical protein
MAEYLAGEWLETAKVNRLIEPDKGFQEGNHLCAAVFGSQPTDTTKGRCPSEAVAWRVCPLTEDRPFGQWRLIRE